MTKTKKVGLLLSLGALGVVFGDIGTSPLYAMQALFGEQSHKLAATHANVYGVVSLIIWAITLVVSVKYILFLMRTHNAREGGVMALVSLVKKSTIGHHRKAFLLSLGLIGVALFYGESVITPAISVLSAVEGLKVSHLQLDNFIVPIGIAILLFLFWLQRYGTATIGKLFGPIMSVWFIVIAIAGLNQVIQHPDILLSLLPTTALGFFWQHPLSGLIAMTAVVLAITGAEALYADMGNFGRKPIARAWFWLVFPALALNYMGQAALLVHVPLARANPFFMLFPENTRIAVVALATIATLIASQAVISGAFSLTRQAVQLGFLPKMVIRHTSAKENGQVYIPFINGLLFIIVVLIAIGFGSSEKLAGAYGIAVSGTLAISSVLYLSLMKHMRRKPLFVIVILGFIFLTIELLFVVTNLSKIPHGGWLPLLLGSLILVLITTWIKGQKIIRREREEIEGTLPQFVSSIHHRTPPLPRLTGSAIYINHHRNLAPLALHAVVKDFGELPENVIIVSVKISEEAHIRDKKRIVYDPLTYSNDGLSHLIVTFGFHDIPDVPKALELVCGTTPELQFDPNNVAYFISQARINRTGHRNLSKWRKVLYSLMVRLAVPSTDLFKLPPDRTILISTSIDL
jgi:KUP system potassium uptake protein